MPKPHFPKPRFEQGATVLVTGATGLVGSNIAEQLVIAGYQVRLVTRKAARAEPLQQHLESLHGKGSAEIVELADATDAKALDQILQGVSGIVHVATDASMSSNVDAVIVYVEKMLSSLLEAAERTSTVKLVVLTSSSTAAFTGQEPQPIVVTEQTFTDHVVDLAYRTPDSHPSKAALTYMASKVKAERSFWELCKDKHYAFNTVLPNFVTGPPSNPDRSGTYSSYGYLRQLAQGEWGPHTPLYGFLDIRSGYFNDARDVGRAHVAALVAEEVNHQRIFAMTDLFCAQDLAEAIQRAKPQLKVPSVQGSVGRFDLHVPNQPFKDLLKTYYGTAPVSFDESVAASVSDL